MHQQKLRVVRGPDVSASGPRRLAAHQQARCPGRKAGRDAGEHRDPADPPPDLAAATSTTTLLPPMAGPVLLVVDHLLPPLSGPSPFGRTRHDHPFERMEGVLRQQYRQSPVGRTPLVFPRHE